MLTSIRNVKFYKNALEYNVYHRCLGADYCEYLYSRGMDSFGMANLEKINSLTYRKATSFKLGEYNLLPSILTF